MQFYFDRVQQTCHRNFIFIRNARQDKINYIIPFWKWIGKYWKNHGAKYFWKQPSQRADQLPRHLHIPLTVVAAFIFGGWYLPHDEHLLLQEEWMKIKDKEMRANWTKKSLSKITIISRDCTSLIGCPLLCRKWLLSNSQLVCIPTLLSTSDLLQMRKPLSFSFLPWIHSEKIPSFCLEI